MEGSAMSSPGITKKALADAMKRLMAERPLVKINIGDIVKKCGLNRNSFYYHFKDKYDLVNWIFYTEIAEEFNREQVAGESGWVLIEKLCHFFYRNKQFYINALSVTGQNSFEEYYLDLLKTLMMTRVPDMFEEDDHKDFYINFFVDAFSATTLRWLRSGAKIPPEELAALMKKAATRAATRILDESKLG